jgi:hypothetical protein
VFPDGSKFLAAWRQKRFSVSWQNREERKLISHKLRAQRRVRGLESGSGGYFYRGPGRQGMVCSRQRIKCRDARKEVTGLLGA